MSDGDGPGETGVGDRVAAAVEELYGADPQAFTERRGELAAAARSAGDREGAKAIGALRRPTRAAWVVNNLARSDPGAPAKLAELATALRAAQQAGHGPRLRELSAARGALVDALTKQAFSLAGVPDAPPSLRAEVTDTLTAAVADPEVAAGFASGTLTRAMQWSGFGVLPEAAGAGGTGEGAAWPGIEAIAGRGEDSADRKPGGIDGGPAIPRPRLGVITGGRAASGTKTGAGDADALPSEDALPDEGAGTGSRAVRTGTRTETARDRRAGGRSAAGKGTPDRAELGRRTAAAKASAEAGARRQAEAAERLAQEAAERAARRREQYADAERLVASTAAAAADALSNEDRLEAEVRDLEDRLTRTRADLAAIRMKARHAEAAERRARQALDRLPRE